MVNCLEMEWSYGIYWVYIIGENRSVVGGMGRTKCLKN